MEKKALEQAVFSVVETTVRNMDVIQRVNIPELSLQANLKQDLGLDSLSLAELSVRLENEFGVDVYEENTPETVGDIIKILSRPTK